MLWLIRSAYVTVPLLIVACAGRAGCQQIDSVALAAAFRGAQQVDLRANQSPSVVALRDRVKIPPPSETVLVKTFERASLPPVLRPAFAKPQVAGVTIGGRFIAIVHTELRKEYDDILGHELVHAYISLASPKPLPFWFQEGSAVYFSMGKTRKFYGQPAKDKTGVMVGRVVELDPVYKQKLHTFLYLADRAGESRFRKWFRGAVVTGTVNTDLLLGGPSDSAPAPTLRKPVPLWLVVVAGIVVVAVLVLGFYASRRDSGYY